MYWNIWKKLGVISSCHNFCLYSEFMNIKDRMKAEFPKLLWQECLSSACVTQRWDSHNINLVAPLCIICSPPTLLAYEGWSRWISWLWTWRQSCNSHRGQDFLTHHILGSVVSVANRCGLGGPGVESQWRREFPHPSVPALGSKQPHVKWTLGLFSRG
jgi:hypothetical protein